MERQLENLFRRFAVYGVLHRDEVRGNEAAVDKLTRLKFVQKVLKRGRVYYELTPKAVQPLELHRKSLLGKVEFRSSLHPKSKVYKALLEDVRFLNTKKVAAQEFQFLGDWQLTLPVRRHQLGLARLRYYEERGLA